MSLLRATLLPAIAALSLVLSGCFDDSSTADNSPANDSLAAVAPATDTPPTDTPITDVAPETPVDTPTDTPVVDAPVDTPTDTPVADVPVDTPPADTPPDTTPTGVALSGLVLKGVTANALVSVYAPDGTGGFTLLGSTVSDAQGAYAITLPAGYAGPIKIVASASVPPDAPTLMRCDAASGCGMSALDTTHDVNANGIVDFGEWFQVGADFSLRAVAVVDALGIHFVNLTPLSSLAADWAEKFPQGLDARSALAANEQAAVAFGFATIDLERPLGDIADPLWLRLADPQQVKLALLMATFAELATQFNVDSQFVIETFSTAFSNQQGRLIQASDGPTPSIAVILGTAATLAGTLDMPVATQTEIESSITLAMATLQLDTLSSHEDITIASLLTRLGPLGVQVDELLGLTGLNDPQSFIMAQAPFFTWLLTPDTLQLVPLAGETAIWALAGSFFLDLPSTPDTMDFINDGVSSITLDKVAKKLRVTGYRHGQTVDIAVSLTSLRSGALASQFDFGVVGTIANGTATGSIDGTLSINTLDTDMSGLLDALTLAQASDPTAMDALKLALFQLANSAKANVSLAGNAQLVRTSDPTQVLGGDVALAASVDLGAALGQTIATLNVSSANLVLPNGDHFYGREGMPVLTVTVGDNATLVLDGAAMTLGLPEATAHAEGTLFNARSLVDHVRNTLITQLSGSTIDLGAMITALLNFDLSQLSIHGTGVIEIPAINHEYRAALDNFTATVYQPHSNDVAMTATLDLNSQAVHLVLGDEPWELKLLMTPTPRVVMLGPDGQFAEATQEDFYAFLDTLPIGGLLASLVSTP